MILFFTGVFNPPIDGVYLLTVYTLGPSAGNGPVFMKNNDDILCSTWVVPIGDSTGTYSVVAQLTVGNSVRVTDNSELSTDIQASYSGFVDHIFSVIT